VIGRRLWVAAVSALLAAPRLHAQPQRPPRKLGYLHPRTIAPNFPTLVMLRAQWQKLGYVEGETVLLRSADNDLSRVPALLDDMVNQGVGAVIVVGAAAVRAANQATKTLPIVAIDLETDPVRAGYAASFSRPGGNVTGLFLDQPSIAGKWIDLLREAAPQIERLAIVWDSGTGVDQLEVAKSVSRAKGFEAVVLELGAIRDFDQAFRGLAGRPRTGLVQLSAPGFTLVAEPFATAARKHRLPAISFLKEYAQSGMLMTYGPNRAEWFLRAVVLADKILKGAKPGELAIEGPDRFELVINLATARALGLNISQSLLLRADEVIQ
jgi:putative ABC transport system substrate-binding protein